MSGEWRVIYEQALERWKLDEEPELDRLMGLLNWLIQCTEHGPPGEDESALPVPLDEELRYVYRLPSADVIITYYVAVHERLILVRDISSR